MNWVLSDDAWIWADWYGAPNQYMLARQTFEATGEAIASGVRLRLCADAQATVHINGRAVDARWFAYHPESRRACEIDITGYVRPGENELRVLAYCPADDSSTYRAGRPALCFAITAAAGAVLLVRSGADTQVSAATGYRNGPVDKVSGQLR